ncbi:MAG: phosphatase PAP2 family protein [Methylotenera sp.]|nr:phosphatase PAP2 family protein [Methylotenera sp.]
MKISHFTIALLHSPRFILMLGVFAAYFFGWMFSEIAEEIWIEKEIFPLDQITSAWMADGQHPLGQQLFSALTMLGSFKWLAILALAVAGLLIYKKLRLESIILLGGFALTAISIMLIKFLSDRTRPYSNLSLLENTMSFPSGHMAHSLFVYGFLAYLLSRCVRNRMHSLWIMISGVGLAGMIGISRLYLNVHWLSDVLAGFTLAAAYLCLCIAYLESARHNNNEALPNKII